MTNLPKFKTAIDQDTYIGIFEDKLQAYWALMTRVKNKFYGDDSLTKEYKWEELQPKTIEIIRDITSDLMYKTEVDFKEQFPEYKTSDDELFIPYRSFKENVTEALKEAMNETKEVKFAGNYEGPLYAPHPDIEKP